MMQQIAMIGCLLCIAGLFVMERAEKLPTSKALWLPLAWLVINGSRSVSQWFTGSMSIDTERYSEGTPADAAVFGMLIISGLLVLNIRSNKVRNILKDNYPMLLFFGYCIASIVWSDYPFVAIKRMVKAIGDIVMLLLVLTDPYPLIALKRLFARLAFILLPLSLLLILAYPDLGTFYDTTSNITYYNGVTTQKNSLGQTCLVCGLGLLWLLLGAYHARRMPLRRIHMISYGALLAVSVFLIVKADSMTSLACFVLAGAVIVLAAQRWVPRLLGGIHVIVIGAVGLAVFAVFLDSAGSLLHGLGRNSTLTGRTDIWRAVLALHTNPLLGTGYESFWLGNRLQFVWDATDRGILQAHNGYLEIYINLGWVGVILLGGLIVTGYRHALAAFYRDPTAGGLGLAFFAASLMFSLSEAGFRMMNLIWFAFLLAITGIPSGSQNGKHEIMIEMPMALAVRPSRLTILQ
jgi:O-antigen ligase